MNWVAPIALFGQSSYLCYLGSSIGKYRTECARQQNFFLEELFVPDTIYYIPNSLPNFAKNVFCNT